MQTTISAKQSATVNEILMVESETVKTGYLLVVLKLIRALLKSI